MKRITLRADEISALKAGLPVYRRVPADVFRNRPELDKILAKHPNQCSCPLGETGDQFWVAETHAMVPESSYRCSTGIYQRVNPEAPEKACIYKQNFDRADGGLRWRSPAQMPRWASRFTLEAKSVRVERTNPEAQDDSREWDWVMELVAVKQPADCKA